MHYWRVTKYDPKYRDSNDIYLIDEWTAFSDIDNYFNGIKLTLESYLSIENAYIDAVISSMKESKVEYLKVTELEKIEYIRDVNISNNISEEFYNSLRNGMSISIKEISMFVRLVLREMIWGKLVSNNLFVHFGYDYYMYIGSQSKLDRTEEIIIEKGLFVEHVVSPYIE